jgi:hypothetical protein
MTERAALQTDSWPIVYRVLLSGAVTGRSIAPPAERGAPGGSRRRGSQHTRFAAQLPRTAGLLSKHPARKLVPGLAYDECNARRS